MLTCDGRQANSGLVPSKQYWKSILGSKLDKFHDQNETQNTKCYINTETQEEAIVNDENFQYYLDKSQMPEIPNYDTRFLTFNEQQGYSGFVPSKQCWKPILNSNLDEFHDQEKTKSINSYKSIETQEEQIVNDENLQYDFDNSQMLETPNCNMESIQLPPDQNGFEKNNSTQNLDKGRLTKKSAVDPEVGSYRMSTENYRLLIFQTANNRPMTQHLASLTSDYFKTNQDTHSSSSKVIIPTTGQLDAEVAKKHSCLPPLGPPPILQPPPPRQPPMPNCPKKKKDKKKKCSIADARYLITNRQATRFVGCHQTEDQILATRRALAARCSKSVLEKALKGHYIF